METKDVVRRMKEAMIPLETMWNDIDVSRTSDE